MAKLEIPLNVQGMEPVKTLFELITHYYAQLPEGLQKSIVELFEDSEFVAGEFTANDWRNRGLDGGDVETDFPTTEIVSVNKILKRVRYREDGIALEAYPEKFKLGAKGHVIIEWGY